MMERVLAQGKRSFIGNMKNSLTERQALISI